ncbi:FecR domain-containing protein [Sphingomonas sp. NIBR02145]|uniref:FecR family protein n=1 Tax=Sphingomonas sp. NIBR02145 TaxID=3014784 RepID=UPI0022B33290|nr:FecR domain-containing protein [Sphingomonas sp. NIBR02145]WHU02409.1 FecR domain-containing protein [Sphingomonas sp. NIBR02145]
MTMSEDQAEEGDDALAREAAHWFARMRGPDADASRAEFEAWLAQGAEHRGAYNDAAEVFALGKLLAESGEPAPAPPPRPRPQRRRRMPAVELAASVALVAGVGGWVAWHPNRSAPSGQEAVAATTDHRRISTVAGERRVVRLADGSTVHLGDGTIIDIDIAARQRDLRLLQGQARFEVAHEQRPFIVHAGGGSVTARGTVFEVALTRAGKVDVRLLQGAVDVALPRPAPSAQPAIRKLAAGEGVSFAAQPEAAATPAASDGGKALPTNAAHEFEAVPVAELVALANKGSARPIRLADASLGPKRVSGRFQVGDTGLLARRLGALFGSEVRDGDPREIVLAQPGD